MSGLHKIMIAAIGMAIATPAAAEEMDFILTNNTGKEIKTVELGPKGTAPWLANKTDPELNRTGAIKSGGRATIHFDKAGSECSYAIKASFADSTSATSAAVNLCDNSYVTLTLATDGSLTATAN